MGAKGKRRRVETRAPDSDADDTDFDFNDIPSASTTRRQSTRGSSRTQNRFHEQGHASGDEVVSSTKMTRYGRMVRPNNRFSAHQADSAADGNHGNGYDFNGAESDDEFDGDLDDLDDDDDEVIIRKRTRTRQVRRRSSSSANPEYSDDNMTRKNSRAASGRSRSRRSSTRSATRSRSTVLISMSGDPRDVGPVQAPNEHIERDSEENDESEHENGVVHGEDGKHSGKASTGSRLRRKPPVRYNDDDDEDYEIDEDDEVNEEDNLSVPGDVVKELENGKLGNADDHDDDNDEDGNDDSEKASDDDDTYHVRSRPRRLRSSVSRFAAMQEQPRPSRTSRRARDAGHISQRRPRRPATRASAAAAAADSYRPLVNSMRAKDYYDDESPEERGFMATSDSSDNDALGPANAAQPDYLRHPMAVSDDRAARSSRSPRAGRYTRRRSRAVPEFDGAKTSRGSSKPTSVGIEPIQVDLNLSWNDIGGLDHHIRSLKEMVFLPLLYPEVFEKFQMEPPKGVLFYGPPGTGKTLCARALAASCGAVQVDGQANDVVETNKVEIAEQGSLGANSLTDPGARPMCVQNTAHDVASTQIASTSGNESFLAQSDSRLQVVEENLEGAKNSLSIDRSDPKSREPVDESREDDTEPKHSKMAVDPPLHSAETAVSLPSVSLPHAVTKAQDQTACLAGSISPIAGIEKRSSTVAPKQRPRVAFFMRNGADCLSKWVGEAERQLRMTFEAAKKHQPSIIFFDEIDGLAPVRTARQDQIHSSIVSTLLGLMDGLDARGKIIVIGATNRIDAVDPALRRPGRFDRELIFTLPNGVARRKILDIHTANWRPKPPDHVVLHAVAKRTVGYCGADLRALCSEAALRALRRRYPQIYESQDKLLIDVNQVQVRTTDFASAMKDIVPASHRSARTHARPLPSRLQCILSNIMSSCIEVIKKIFSHGIPPDVRSQEFEGTGPDKRPQNCPGPRADQEEDEEEEYLSDCDDVRTDETFDVDSSSAGTTRLLHRGKLLDRPVLRPRLLLCGPAGLGQSQVGPALLHVMEGCPVHAIDLPSLHASGGSHTPEEALVVAIREACRAVPSVLYLPHLQLWWETASEILRTTLVIALRDIPAELPLLVLATAEEVLDKLPSALTELFADFVEVEVPSEMQRRDMLVSLRDEACMCPVVTDAALKRKKARRLAEVLPKAPPTPLRPISEAEATLKEREDDRYIRELRMEMRVFVERLLRDRKYKAFWLPVDPLKTPDYLTIVKEPMDISKIAAQVDKGMYPTVLAMVKDFDTMVKNAIQYNPAHTEEGAAILRRAHGLVDIVHAWVDNLDPHLVERCNSIVTARLANVRKESSNAASAAAAAATMPTTSLLPGTQSVVGIEPQVNAVAPNKDPACEAMVIDGEGSNPNANGDLRKDCEMKLANPSARQIKLDEGSQDNLLQVVDTEEPYFRPDKDELAKLERAWIDVTTGLSVDALDILYVRCSSILFDYRRCRDRRLVIRSLFAAIEQAKDDPTLKLAV